MTLRIDGDRILLEDGIADTALMIADGRIAGIGASGAAERRLDARGLLVLPGIVDLHGDAFERQLQPRPRVAFAIDIALADTEAQLLANGITTAFHALTLSWEPGLRSPVAWRAFIDALSGRGNVCDMRVHMRWELHNLGAIEMALEDVASGRVHLVSFNDHTPAILAKLGTPAGAATYSERAMMSVGDFRSLAEQAMAHGPEVPAATARLAAAARRAGLAMASHDDDTIATRARYRALGAGICEFPMAEEVGRDARAAGEAVVMGCPNVVRGGSHLGWASAASLSERGVCSVLVSDYYYPAMARAGLMLGAGPLGIEGAWALVSRNAARAVGLDDRGTIGLGKRADIVLLEPKSGGVVATIAQGRVAYLSAEGWSRLR